MKHKKTCQIKERIPAAWHPVSVSRQLTRIKQECETLNFYFNVFHEHLCFLSFLFVFLCFFCYDVKTFDAFKIKKSSLAEASWKLNFIQLSVKLSVDSFYSTELDGSLSADRWAVWDSRDSVKQEMKWNQAKQHKRWKGLRRDSRHVNRWHRYATCCSATYRIQWHHEVWAGAGPLLTLL